jgi:hypothetical protein
MPALNRSPPQKDRDAESVEESSPAFGFLRGIREFGSAIEFRFRDGNSAWFPYSWLDRVRAKEGRKHKRPEI